MLAVLLPALAPPPPDVDEAADRARAILEQPEYQPRTRHPVERVLDWVFDRIGDVFSTASSGGNRIVGFLVVVGGVLLIARIISKLRFPLPASTDDADEPVVEVLVGRTPSSWADEADEAERRGEWTDAVRARYRFALATVLEHGHLEDVPGRTSGEYRRALRAVLPEVGDAVDDLTATFEGAWYGHVTTTRDDAASARRDAASIAEAAIARRADRPLVGVAGGDA
jgi:hypothetical protein